MSSLPCELAFEPALALFGAPHTTYRALFVSASSRLPIGSFCALEIGAGQAPRIIEEAAALGWQCRRQTRDGADHIRILLFQSVAKSVAIKVYREF